MCFVKKKFSKSYSIFKWNDKGSDQDLLRAEKNVIAKDIGKFASGKILPFCQWLYWNVFDLNLCNPRTFILRCFKMNHAII